MLKHVFLLDPVRMICSGHPVDLVDPEEVAASIGMDKQDVIWGFLIIFDN